MEWTQSLKMAVDYMEQHMLEDISAEDVAESVFISPFYFQKGFKIMTGYTITEYIRNRRLYLAALDIVRGHEKIINLAYKYGYDTPESFTKAFSRFHGASPMQIKSDAGKITPFLPLKIIISVKGGNEMDYVVERMQKFQVIGFVRTFSFETAYQEIPKFWDEFCENCMEPLFLKEKPAGNAEQVICDCRVGEYGVCLDDIRDDGKFRYMIAGTYHGEEVPEGMGLYSFPDMEWAKFRCVGQMPGALQSVNTKIFKEWLPGNPEYEIAMGANIEWYSRGDTSAIDYESGIWIPVKHK